MAEVLTTNRPAPVEGLELIKKGINLASRVRNFAMRLFPGKKVIEADEGIKLPGSNEAIKPRKKIILQEWVDQLESTINLGLFLENLLTKRLQIMGVLTAMGKIRGNQTEVDQKGPLYLKRIGELISPEAVKTSFERTIQNLPYKIEALDLLISAVRNKLEDRKKL